MSSKDLEKILLEKEIIETDSEGKITILDEKRAKQELILYRKEHSGFINRWLILGYEKVHSWNPPKLVDEIIQSAIGGMLTQEDQELFALAGGVKEPWKLTRNNCYLNIGLNSWTYFAYGFGIGKLGGLFLAVGGSPGVKSGITLMGVYVTANVIRLGLTHWTHKPYVSPGIEGILFSTPTYVRKLKNMNYKKQDYNNIKPT
jgi:hypothetical protein